VTTLVWSCTEHRRALRIVLGKTSRWISTSRSRDQSRDAAEWLLVLGFHVGDCEE
jgi:hypothetical protein